MNRRFLEIEPEFYNAQKARFVVIPCPHEATVTYGRGTKRGPAAILQASQQVETFDQELGYEAYRRAGIYTEKQATVVTLQSTVARVIKDNKLPVILGGEHSLTPSAVKPLVDKYPELSVLQLDAHADLRDSYRGKKNSHACTMRRVLELCPAVQAGIRSISAEEFAWAKASRQLERIHWAGQLDQGRIIRQLKKQVYITIDVDVFDPAVIPATGTPEPGGLFWPEVVALLKAVCAHRTVVGFDVVELAPRQGEVVSDFTIAKLAYKLIGYLTAKKA
jgi:agmatinase